MCLGWQCDHSIGREKHAAGVVVSVNAREDSTNYKQFTKELRSVHLRITLPSPVHPRNSSEQRVQPARFYLAACSVGPGIEISYIRSLQRQGVETHTPLRVELHTQKVFFRSLKLRTTPISGQRSTALRQALLGALPEVATLDIRRERSPAQGKA